MEGPKAPKDPVKRQSNFYTMKTPDTPEYHQMIARSLMQTGNNSRLKAAIDRAREGKQVTMAFIGGSITQGAGAVPINTECYAWKAFQGFCSLAGRGTEENICYVKAGVGGTSSELGMIRYETDVLDDGRIAPDIVIVEFAVNDAGDETNGKCYDSLVRKILSADNHPAVVLLFSVFENDWNLQERLSVVGEAYRLPMVSVKNSVVDQFYKEAGYGQIVSKQQFFYDCYHPTNIGHTIMADGLIHLFRTVDAQTSDQPDDRVLEGRAPIGGEFQNVQLLDRRHNRIRAVIRCGDFCQVDTELQMVERDRESVPTGEFPDNWMYPGCCSKGTEAWFAMDIVCSTLLLVFKDSDAADVGAAEVYADGEKVLIADPSVNGWVHCNAAICFCGWERKLHHVEIKMRPGDETKKFTILSFGYVE